MLQMMGAQAESTTPATSEQLVEQEVPHTIPAEEVSTADPTCQIVADTKWENGKK